MSFKPVRRGREGEMMRNEQEMSEATPGVAFPVSWAW